jgi:hypothetical protein
MKILRVSLWWRNHIQTLEMDGARELALRCCGFIGWRMKMPSMPMVLGARHVLSVIMSVRA